MFVISQECHESNCGMMFEVFWRAMGQIQRNFDINGTNWLCCANSLGLFLVLTGNLNYSGLFEKNNSQFKQKWHLPSVLLYSDSSVLKYNYN